jgi:hypothetical protein
MVGTVHRPATRTPALVRPRDGSHRAPAEYTTAAAAAKIGRRLPDDGHQDLRLAEQLTETPGPAADAPGIGPAVAPSSGG